MPEPGTPKAIGAARGNRAMGLEVGAMHARFNRGAGTGRWLYLCFANDDDVAALWLELGGLRRGAERCCEAEGHSGDVAVEGRVIHRASEGERSFQTTPFLRRPPVAIKSPESSGLIRQTHQQCAHRNHSRNGCPDAP